MSNNPAEIRKSTLDRETAETRVSVELCLDGEGRFENQTGIGFLDHMLDLFAKHGGFDLKTTCVGDVHVDDHHSVEDVGITLGLAFKEALSDKAFIARYGFSYVPMDESLARAVVDLSGRFACVFKAAFSRDSVGDLSTEMVEHFWASFAENVGCNLHIELLYGNNAHHQIEAIYKAVARALRLAVCRDASLGEVASTKGSL